jgi:soluble lytic murein transglycosylase-like protein
VRSIGWLAGLVLGVALMPAPAAAQPAPAATESLDDSARIAAWREQAVAYEHGNGVAQDGARAVALYCQAARLGDAASQYDLGWMYAYGRGVSRDDALAAFFFQLAAAQGVGQAATMLKLVGPPVPGVPACLRDPAPAAVEPVAAAPQPQPAPAAAPILAPRPIADLVRKIAPEYGVPPALVFAIMEAESSFDAAAVSPRNAQGLMQLIPETARRFRVRKPLDPAQNIRGGMAYLRWLLAYFEGDVALVAAAYNAGERTVERYRGVPPYGETRAYVRRILAAVGAIAQPYDASVADPSPHLDQIRARRAVK